MTDSIADDFSLDEVPDERISEEEFRNEKPRIRLRLHHLFALMAVMAVLLTIARPQTLDFGNSGIQLPAAVQTIQSAFTVIFQIPAAVALTALGFGIAAYRRGE